MIKIFPNIDELNNFAAQKFVEIANEAIEKRGNFTVALAGGSTPKSLYQLLASDKFRDKVFWKAVHFYFGDERNVPPTDDQSNFRMAKENLFEPLKISEFQIERWKTEFLITKKIVENYEERLLVGFTLAANNEELMSVSLDLNGREWFPRFDLILLGMGADGHTASLFPYTKALSDTKNIAVANEVKKLNSTRLTLTFPTINNAANIIFLVAGEDKAEALHEVLEGEFEPEKYPSQNIKPKNGELYWLIDKNVTKLLENNGN